MGRGGVEEAAGCCTVGNGGGGTGLQGAGAWTGIGWNGKAYNVKP